MRRTVIVAGVVGLALVAGACSSGSKSSGATATTTKESPAGGVDPNAPEVNPPGDIPDDQVFVAYTPPAGGFTVASAQQSEVPAITTAVKNIASVRDTFVTRKSGKAVLIKYRADSTPDAVTGKVRRLDVERYELWRNGTQAVLTLSGPQGADNVDPWRIVTDSFAWQ